MREVSAYDRIEAETIAWNKGIKVSACKENGGAFGQFNRQLTDLQDGDWTSVSQVAFGEKGAKSFTANVASAKGGKIEIRLDSPQGSLIGTLDVEATGSADTFKALTCDVDRVTGTRNVFLVFRGSGTDSIMNVDYYLFGEASTGPVDPEPADTSKLSAKIKDAENLLEVLSAAEKTKLQAAINTAKAVLNKENVSQEEVDAALAALSKSVEAAKESLKPQKPNYGAYLNKSFTTKDGLKWKITKCSEKTKEVSLTGAAKQLTKATIPSFVKYDGMSFKVTAIASKALRSQAKLTNVTIGKYVTKIGTQAFANSKKLAKITFQGTAIKSIGKDAFKGIKKTAAFSMKKTFVSGSLKYQITKCTASAKTVKVTGASKQLSKLAIPATVKYNGMSFQVTAIGKKAFKNSKKLTTVTVGKYVKTIEAEAFCNSKKLAKIKFSGTAVKTIKKNAFAKIKKSAAFDVKNSKKAYYKKLLNKANTKNFKVK